MFVAQNMAIKRKLIAIVMLTCVAALLVAGGAFIFWEWRGLQSSMLEELSTQARIIAENSKAALSFDDAQDAGNTLKALKANSSIVFGCVYKKTGETFATYFRSESDKVYEITRPQDPGHILSEGFLTIFEPIMLDDEIIGIVCLRSDLSSMYAALRRNATNTGIVLLLAALAAYIISSRLQRIISGPILCLAEVARNVSEKGTTQRVPPNKATTKSACS